MSILTTVALILIVWVVVALATGLLVGALLRRRAAQRPRPDMAERRTS